MSLEEKLSDKSAVFGIVGLGYVGLPLAVEMAKEGYHVIGFELDIRKIKSVNKGESYIPDVPTDVLSPLVGNKLIEATGDFSRAGECAAIVLCVPTPLNKNKEPDTSYMESAASTIAPYLKEGQLVTLESTTYPGTTEEVIMPLLERDDFKVGEQFCLAFSPERVDPGNPTYQTKNTPKVVGGVTPVCTKAATAFYESFLDQVVAVSTARAAEMSKILENTFRCVNIAMMNELAMLSERMDINLWEVIDAAKTKPFGYMPFYPGPGLGGHCIPIDPFYLSWKARQFDFRTEFIDMSGKINDNMPYYVLDRAMTALNKQRKALNGARILVLGVAYKADIDDRRESPAIKVIDLLLKDGADVVYHDPYVPDFSVGSQNIPRVELTEDQIKSADLVLVLTGHTNVDYQLVAESASLILDTRNVMAEFNNDGNKIVLL